MVEIALTVKDEKVNTTAIEIFSQFVEVVPTLVREFILKEVESRASISGLKASSKQSLCTPNASLNVSYTTNTAVLNTPTLATTAKTSSESNATATSSTQPSTSHSSSSSPRRSISFESGESVNILPLSSILGNIYFECDTQGLEALEFKPVILKLLHTMHMDFEIRNYMN